MRRYLLLTLLLGALLPLGAAEPAPQPAHGYPIRGVEGLYAANFGEIRPGHFHAGVDIKTDGVEGKEVVATADGYVSRIAVTAGGYGRALYITCKDGITVVYGHLSRYRDDIEEVLRAERYRRQSNSADLHFTPDRWPVAKGDLVGYSGNSGSSMGPHLHYELRETLSQRRINPVTKGYIRPKDTIPPRIVRIHYVEIDSVQGVCVGSMTPYGVVRDASGSYRLTHTGPLPVGPRGYFVAEVTDRRDGVYNTFGVRRLTALLDGERYFEYCMEGFAPAYSRCSDAVSCYALQLASRNEVIRLARLTAAPRALYTCMEQRGVVRAEVGQRRRMRIEVEDDMGNSSSLEFDIEGHPQAPAVLPEAIDQAVVLRPEAAGFVTLGDELTLRVPSGALYEAVFSIPQRLPAPRADSGTVVLSPLYRLFDAPTPLYEAARVTLRTRVPHHLQLRAALARRTPSGALAFVGGRYADGAVTAETRTVEELCVVADTLAPHVRPQFAEGADLRNVSELRFRATDNFAGVASCRLTIDGAWVPCDRQPVQGLLFHRFDAPADRSRHTYRLTVTDAVGNTAVCTGSFVR